MTHRMQRSLVSLSIGCLLWLLPMQHAEAQVPGCEAMSTQPLNLQAFRKVAQTYIGSSTRPAAASALLLCLQGGGPELPETLMLFQRRLRAPPGNSDAVEDAFLHYVINTPQPRMASTETANLERLASRYVQSLFLPAALAAEAMANCEGASWTLARLQCTGREANLKRYGRGDVVPVELIDLNPSDQGYARRHAAWMAQMSALAYWNPELVAQQLQQWGFQPVAKVSQPSNDTSGFIASRDQVLVLAFRGTSSFKNFLTDGNFLRVAADHGKGTVHNGFKTALDSVWDQIRSALGPPQAQQKEVWVTGHSLGAALAQLAALRLHEAGYRVRNVYTFGTPRIGDQDFVEHYDRQLGSKSFPHINVSDVVTRVPPQLLGYRAAASGSAQKFTGVSHQMSPLSAMPANSTEAAPVSGRRALEAITQTTDFLPGGLRPAALANTKPAAPVSANLYATTFKSGSLDEHGSFEYLFKLACAVIDYDLWPLEKTASERRTR